MDAGYYLCDFIYYCSLAEAQRAVAPSSQSPNHVETPDRPQATKVLFLHVPPVDKPLSTEEMRDAIKRIVVWVCSGLM
jgi:pyroglutamyl-peptidase